MKLTDVHDEMTVEVWESKMENNLALSVGEVGTKENYKTATLSPEDCIALGTYLLLHAKKAGHSIPSF